MEQNPKVVKIIETSRGLFMRYGIRRVSIEEICREAGVSKMTFYKYFKNKIDVVEHIVESLARDGLDRYTRFMSEDIPYEDKIRKLIQLKAEITEGISSEFLKDLMSIDDPDFIEWYHRLARQRMELFLNHFKEAKENGDIRMDIKPEFILYMMNKLMQISGDDELLRLYESPKDMTEDLMNFLFYGILARKRAETHV